MIGIAPANHDNMLELRTTHTSIGSCVTHACGINTIRCVFRRRPVCARAPMDCSAPKRASTPRLTFLGCQSWVRGVLVTQQDTPKPYYTNSPTGQGKDLEFLPMCDNKYSNSRKNFSGACQHYCCEHRARARMLLDHSIEAVDTKKWHLRNI